MGVGHVGPDAYADLARGCTRAPQGLSLAWVLPQSSIMSEKEDAKASSAGVVTVMGFCGAGLGALIFGAGFGAGAYRRSAAYKDLIEKFPEPPTVEAEALARRGAGRALVGGTALAALMGVGAVAVARLNGICSAADFGDAMRKWLPSHGQLEASVRPKLEPLQRTITETLQPARESSGGSYQKSSLGRRLSKRAEESSLQAQAKPLEVRQPQAALL